MGIFNAKIGSLLTRHSQFQSFLESICLLHAGSCNLNIEYLSDSLICDQVKISNMGSGHCILLFFVICDFEQCNTEFNRLLVRLEQIDFDFCSNGIAIKHLFGIITDGHSKWHIIRRNNEQRHLAKDVLNDPLLANNKSFDLMQVLNKKQSGQCLAKFNQTLAVLARERWQIFEHRHRHEIALYDGHYINDCDINQSLSNLNKITQIIHGLIHEQKQCFAKAFKIALRHNSNLNRPAINPFHELNKNIKNKQCNEYCQLSKKVYNECD